MCFILRIRAVGWICAVASVDFRAVGGSEGREASRKEKQPFLEHFY